MRLLFDQNLSFRLVSRLADVFTESAHVKDCGLDIASDLEVWTYARDNGFCVVTKDDYSIKGDFVPFGSPGSSPSAPRGLGLGSRPAAAFSPGLRPIIGENHPSFGR